MRFFAFIAVLFLAACADGNPENYLRMYNIPSPTPESFTHCHSYGCKNQVEISLPEETEIKIQNIFQKSPYNSEAEQEKIIKSIQVFETDIGALANTDNDKKGTFRLYEENETTGLQQDCIDESTNTTIYLSLLEQMNLLRFHTPAFPANRQPFLGGAPWWHQTAVIQNTQTGKKYAVDTWFRDNGQKGFIVPLEEWKDGWMAPKTKVKI